ERADQSADFRRAARGIRDDVRVLADGSLIDGRGKLTQGPRLPPQQEQSQSRDPETQPTGPEARRQTEDAQAQHATGGNDQRLTRLETDLDLDRAGRNPGQSLERPDKLLGRWLHPDAHLAITKHGQVPPEDEFDDWSLV